MAQQTFASLTNPSLVNLDSNFTELYGLRNLFDVSLGFARTAGTRTFSLAGAPGGEGNASVLLMGNSNSGGAAGPNVLIGVNRSWQFGVGSSFSAADGGTFTQHLRLDSSGLTVGGPGTPSSSQSGVFFGAAGASTFSCGASTSSAQQVLFVNGNGAVGQIVTSGSATTYSTSSDRRLKTAIVDAPDAGATIDALRVVSFDWKAGGHVPFGFIAQELHAVVPDAVVVGDDGEEMVGLDAKPWARDDSKLVPLLVKELQSLRARVAALEATA